MPKKADVLETFLDEFEACDEDQRVVRATYKQFKRDYDKTWEWNRRHQPWNLYWAYSRVFHYLPAVRSQIRKTLDEDMAKTLSLVKGGGKCYLDTALRAMREEAQYDGVVAESNAENWELYRTRFLAIATAMRGLDEPTQKVFQLWAEVATIQISCCKDPSAWVGSDYTYITLRASTQLRRMAEADPHAGLGINRDKDTRAWLKRLKPLTIKDLDKAIKARREG